MKLKMLVTVLLSAALIWSIQQETPVHKSFAATAKAKPVQVVAPEKATEATQTPTEQEATNEPATPHVETPVAQPPVSDQEAEAKDFIYQHESGDNPSATNSLGCFGIGQDCNGIVRNLCGTDYSCQDNYFTNYMLRRYGTWQAAKSFWLARVPINGRDVGHWW